MHPFCSICNRRIRGVCGYCQSLRERATCYIGSYNFHPRREPIWTPDLHEGLGILTKGWEQLYKGRKAKYTVTRAGFLEYLELFGLEKEFKPFRRPIKRNIHRLKLTRRRIRFLI